MIKQPPKRKQQPALDLSKLAQSIRNEFGKESMHIPGQETGFMLSDVKVWIPCGQTLAPILGNQDNGLPCGYYVEIAGPESAGKTTLGEYVIGKAQQAGCVAVLADIEHSYDKEWAAKQGVDNNLLIRLVSAYRKDGKFVIEDVDAHFKRWEFVIMEAKRLYKRPILLVIDSVAALLPRQILEGDYGDATVAALARALSANMPKFQNAMLETNTCVLFINQLRDKIGVLFGEKEVTSGGRAKNFYFMTRVYINNMGKIKSGEKVIGIKIRMRNKKNKIGPPFLDLNGEIRFDTGMVI
jgi:recombination protein RecA